MIDTATRVVHIAGTTTNPDTAFMAQVARNLTDCFAGFLKGKRFLILDRDSKFTTEFKRILKDVGPRCQGSSRYQLIARWRVTLQIQKNDVARARIL